MYWRDGENKRIFINVVQNTFKNRKMLLDVMGLPQYRRNVEKTI